MTVLGIETSTAVCSVGLSNEFGLQSEKSIVESHIHSEKLLTLIQELCNERKTKLQQLDGVAVSIGPGSFTGLRIGLSTAKGLCLALGKPLVAIPTFASVANSAAILYKECGRVIVCIDAKQREYYIGMYEQNNGSIREVLSVRIGDLSTVFDAADTLKTVILTDSVKEIKKEFGDSIIVEDVFSCCRGDVVAFMAKERLNARENDAWEQLEPLYLKDFVVQAKMKLEK